MFTPGVVTAFGMTYMPYYAYLIGLAFAITPLVIVEIFKALKLIKE